MDLEPFIKKSINFYRFLLNSIGFPLGAIGKPMRFYETLLICIDLYWFQWMGLIWSKNAPFCRFESSWTRVGEPCWSARRSLRCEVFPRPLLRHSLNSNFKKILTQFGKNFVNFKYSVTSAGLGVFFTSPLPLFFKKCMGGVLAQT